MINDQTGVDFALFCELLDLIPGDLVVLDVFHLLAEAVGQGDHFFGASNGAGELGDARDLRHVTTALEELERERESNSQLEEADWCMHD